ncbi:site-2 protease family protein [Patescibacteria group bacterium]|nr:site-2 protease family protein [Patescibacteria group bacterium]MBU1703072.1 site-2 protease family protein [Patescibacteria group bacterium]MBU1954223.1 site-2 protease family protein [Patescibacteria group bacterium]
MDFIYLIIALLFVITVHEFSHAWVANYLGDPTAKLEGRVSLNPLRHLDPMGTLLIFLIQIGWGKPVPVNPYYFKKPRRDEALTALAGPLSNLVMAIVFSIPLKYFGPVLGQIAIAGEPFLYNIAGAVVDMSIVLFAFNMIPIPPLDGSKFVQLLIPRRYEHLYENYLRKGTTYFLLFILLDRFFLLKIFGFSLLGQFIWLIYGAIKGAIFLGI